MNAIVVSLPELLAFCAEVAEKLLMENVPKSKVDQAVCIIHQHGNDTAIDVLVPPST